MLLRAHSLTVRLSPVLCLCASLGGCRSVEKTAAPSNFRDWAPDQAVVPYARFDGSRVSVHNVRYCKYFDPETFVVDYYDKTFDLSRLQAVDFFVVPFKIAPTLAHTMLSFEFLQPDGRAEHLAVSIEIRRERDENFAVWKGSARQYELMYVVADERDVVQLRTNHRGEDVYLYRSTASPQQARQLFVDVMERANELAVQPEFYDTITNNCTTNIVRHINRIKPNRIVYDWGILLPGYSDRLAYEEGLIVRHGSFEETKRQAYLNARALQVAGREDFSSAIRR